MIRKYLSFQLLKFLYTAPVWVKSISLGRGMEMFQHDKSSTFSEDDNKSLFYESTEPDSLYDSDFRILNHINADTEHMKQDPQYSHNQNVQDFTDFEGCTTTGLYEPTQMVSKKTEELLFYSERTEPWWRTSDRDELALLVSQRSFGRVENCDLPHPQRTYTKGEDVGRIFTSSNDIKFLGNIKGPMASVYMSLQTVPSTRLSNTERKGAIVRRNMGESDKNDPGNTVLLEALCHSQTRAREAETAAKEAHEEKEHIMKLVFKQASQLFAYKQWFQLLHLENLYYQIKQNEPISKILPLMSSSSPLPLQPPRNAARKAIKPRKVGENMQKSSSRCNYAIAIALGLSLVGAGLLLGWTVGCLFPVF